jgi:arylsulfatase A-like enzyme
LSVALGFLFLLGGCAKEVSRPSFLLLSIDTLRADHLGCYGYARDTSPNLDRFAERSVRFESAVAPSPWTLPSHVAMLTGRHPWELGILDYRSSIPPEVPLLAELLAPAGYQTAAFVDSDPGGFVGAERGFGRGFATYEHAPHDGASRYRYDVAVTADAAIGWLEKRRGSEPFFLFLHTKSVHDTPEPAGPSPEWDAPYDKPEPYRSRFLPTRGLRHAWRDGPKLRGVRYLRELNARIAAGSLDPADFPRDKLEELVALYDAGIYYADEHIGRLLEAVRRLGLERGTVILVTADHGEAFLDHGFFRHLEVYVPLLRVPLLLFDPREPARIVTRAVMLSDIVPTILDRAGVPRPFGLTRPSLLAAEGDGLEEELSLFSYFRFREGYLYEAFALQEGPFKLVFHRRASEPQFRAELYDTRSDPGERLPLDGEGERRRAMTERLRRTVERPDPGKTIELRPETIEQLRALGYLE